GNISVSLPINAVQWGVNGAVPANRPYPQWQQVSMYFKEAMSTYDSLQLKFEKRQSHGLYLLASYTLASARDEGSFQDTLLPDFSNLDTLLRAGRQPQTQTARHRLTITEVWQLPIGRGRAIGSEMRPWLDALAGGWQV